MAHLGYLLTALADGQLSAATAEKVLEHVTVCPGCAAELAAERRARRLLADAECEAVPAGLADRLRTIETTAEVDAAEPAHGPRRVATWLAVGSVVGASTLAVSLFALGGLRTTAPALSDTGALTSLGRVADEPPASGAVTVALTAPAAGHFTVTGERALEDGTVVELSGRGGHVVLVVQRGRLDTERLGYLDPVELAGAPRYVLEIEPWHAVWQSGDEVVELVTDLPPEQVVEVVAHFPAKDYDAAPTARIARGWSLLTGGWNR